MKNMATETITIRQDMNSADFGAAVRKTRQLFGLAPSAVISLFNKAADARDINVRIGTRELTHIEKGTVDLSPEKRNMMIKLMNIIASDFTKGGVMMALRAQEINRGRILAVQELNMRLSIYFGVAALIALSAAAINITLVW